MGGIESAPLREDGTPRSYFAQIVDPHGLLVEPSGEYSGTAHPGLRGDLPSDASPREAPPSPTVDSTAVSQCSSSSEAHVSLDLGDFTGPLADIGDVDVVNHDSIDKCNDGILLTGQALIDESMGRLAGGTLLKRLSCSRDSSSQFEHQRIHSGENIHRQRLRNRSSSDCSLHRPLV